MLVTEGGIVTEVRLLQPENASSPIVITEDGIAKGPVFPPGQVTKIVLFLLYKTPSAELYSGLSDDTFMDVKLLHESNASVPIVVTENGIMMEVKPLHPLNVQSPMLVTVEGIVTETKPLHLPNAQASMLVTE